jgi:hypothetical protein
MLRIALNLKCMLSEAYIGKPKDMKRTIRLSEMAKILPH